MGSLYWINPDKIMLNDGDDEIYYDETPSISFGYFQTSVDGGKEFRSSDTKSHYDMCSDIMTEFVGRAIENEYVKSKLDNILLEIYKTLSYHGRIYTEYNAITMWYEVSNKTLSKILDNFGGVNKYEDYIFTFDSDESGKMYTVGEYLEGSHHDDERYKISYNLKVEDSDDIDEGVLNIIRRYGNENGKLAQLSASLPKGMTIAQYHSLFPESKENKKIIKENNSYMNTKKYNKEFSNYLGIMSEALKRGNFDAYDTAKGMLEESIEECRHENELAAQLNTNNFGILNHIFEERLPELFKKNKKAVRDVIKTIKEDSNLMGEFNYYNAIKQYKGKVSESIEPDVVISKLNEAIVATINKDTVNKSNAKLRKVLKEHNVIPTDFIDDEMKTLYESGHNILTKKTNAIGNVVMIAESCKNISDYMNKHKDDLIKEEIDPDKLIKDFKNKLKETLTESEMSFVQEITDWRSPIAEQRKEKLFNKFKNECIDKVNEMLKEDAGNVELEGLKKQLEEQMFNKDSIVQDIAKLLEIRDILLDK